MTMPVGAGSAIDGIICDKQGPRKLELTVGGTIVSSISLVDRNCPTSVTIPAGADESSDPVLGGVGPNLFKNENEPLCYGGSCKPNYEFVKCTVNQVEGNGSCAVVSTDAANCKCSVNFRANPTQSVRCEVRVYQRKKAQLQAAPPCNCK